VTRLNNETAFMLQVQKHLRLSWNLTYILWRLPFADNSFNH